MLKSRVLETRIDKKIFTKQGFFVRYDDSATFIEVAYNLIKWEILVFSAVFFVYMVGMMFFLKPILSDGSDYFLKVYL